MIAASTYFRAGAAGEKIINGKTMYRPTGSAGI